MTSNLGSEYILDVAGDDTQYDEMQKRVMEALRSHFRPEFLNRIDDLILFHTLNLAELRQIVGFQLKRIHKLLAAQSITLELSEAAQNHIAEAGYDPVYGARPLKRAIQRELENPIATKLLENTFTEGDTILVEYAEGKLHFNRQSLPAVDTPDVAAHIPAELSPVLQTTTPVSVAHEP